VKIPGSEGTHQRATARKENYSSINRDSTTNQYPRGVEGGRKGRKWCKGGGESGTSEPGAERKKRYPHETYLHSLEAYPRFLEPPALCQYN